MIAELFSKGNCIFCGKSVKRAAMVRHLKSCTARVDQIANADKTENEKDIIFHLSIQDAYDENYWLHLEMVGNSKLAKLDNYLRKIWLECCGHLSEFSYRVWDDRIVKTKQAKLVFGPGIKIHHIYDFGSTSEQIIKVVDERFGTPLSSKPIFLMARNDPPEYVCEECSQPAFYYCFECVIEEEKDGYLCKKHGTNHPHHNYGDPIEIVNSPRLGICGYTGPAQPPY